MYHDLATFLDKEISITPDLLGYGAVSPGPPSLRSGMLRLYNSAPFNPVIPVKEEHLEFTGGCTALLDNLFWSLCDEGDGVLIGKPLYGGFEPDMKVRSKVNLVAVSLKNYDPFSAEAVSSYEEELLKKKRDGITIRALILCTPHNPLGQ